TWRSGRTLSRTIFRRSAGLFKLVVRSIFFSASGGREPAFGNASGGLTSAARQFRGLLSRVDNYVRGRAIQVVGLVGVVHLGADVELAVVGCLGEDDAACVGLAFGGRLPEVNAAGRGADDEERVVLVGAK